MSHPYASSSYGTDQVGLIAGFRFAAGEAGSEIDSQQAIEWLQQPANADEFIWLHVNLAHVACEPWLRAQLALPDEFFEALREGSSSTRIEQTNNVLLAVVNDVAFSFGMASSDVASLWGCANQRVLITARTKPLRSVDQLRAAVKRGTRFQTPLALLVHLLQDQADVLLRIVRDTSSKVDNIEDRLLAHRIHDNRTELAAMRRTLVRLQRLLAPEPGSLFRLLNHPPAWVQEADIQALRESTEEFSLVLNDLSSLVERIKLLQEELAAQLNEQTNRTLFTLTMVTVLALPINIVAGFFGMNVGGIPLSQHPHGFWVLVALVASFTWLAGWWAFRKQRQFD
ncbi:zinc transporter [Andreprevotia lacus DSM 23236]|jgi:zinc transporter|uniref:Zinc transporter n=1 Tax=Andreprevotia lacus DSM 23236 TaxID=1121001 RepID=A0A1W1XFM1_9NEIS|nr:transporter [Andreprevotia lacus]SMC22729.1 zinc transporter [Andreprevotia lacus DSM 23236]